MSKKKGDSSSGFMEYLKSSVFLKQLLFIIGLFLAIIFAIQMVLMVYTNHGQKIEMPKLVGLDIDKATNNAGDLSFEIIVNDSIFVVGKKGGIITDQNPKAGSMVKEDRKIYVTITKYGTETINVDDLPILYGNAFDQKKTELKYRDIDCIIKDYAYDPGEPNHILEVWYHNQLIISKDVKLSEINIAKGDKLEFIVSKREGGEVTIPDLRCLNFEEAKFLLETRKLEVGSVVKKGEAEVDDILYVVAQSPPYDGISNIKMGEKISISLSATKPFDCQ